MHGRRTLTAALASGLIVPAMASAHLVSQPDPRRDATGPFDLRKTSMEETSDLKLNVDATTYGRIPSGPPGMPCMAFDYRSTRAADRVACPTLSGTRYELRAAKSGKLVKRLGYRRPDGKTVRLVVPGRLLSGEREIRWYAYIEGGRDRIADRTRWRAHHFGD